jgi:hypothetical protein
MALPTASAITIMGFTQWCALPPSRLNWSSWVTSVRPSSRASLHLVTVFILYGPTEIPIDEDTRNQSCMRTLTCGTAPLCSPPAGEAAPRALPPWGEGPQGRSVGLSLSKPSSTGVALSLSLTSRSVCFFLWGVECCWGLGFVPSHREVFVWATHAASHPIRIDRRH